MLCYYSVAFGILLDSTGQTECSSLKTRQIACRLIGAFVRRRTLSCYVSIPIVSEAMMKRNDAAKEMLVFRSANGDSSSAAKILEVEGKTRACRVHSIKLLRKRTEIGTLSFAHRLFARWPSWPQKGSFQGRAALSSTCSTHFFSSKHEAVYFTAFSLIAAHVEHHIFRPALWDQQYFLK